MEKEINNNNNQFMYKTIVIFGVVIAVAILLFVILFKYLGLNNDKYYHNVGEVATICNFETSIDNFMFIENKTEDACMVSVKINVKNLNNTSKTFLEEVSVRLIYNNEYEYDCMFNFDCELMNSVQPLSQREGIIYFEIPKLANEDRENIQIKLSKNSINTHTFHYWNVV